MGEKVGDEKRTICANCGNIRDCSFVPNPFASEIHDDDTPDWYCGDCLYDLTMEI